MQEQKNTEKLSKYQSCKIIILLSLLKKDTQKPFKKQIIF